MYGRFAANSLGRRLCFWLLCTLLTVGCAGIAGTVLVARKFETSVSQSAGAAAPQNAGEVVDTARGSDIARSGNNEKGGGLPLDCVAPIAMSLLLLALANVLIVCRCLRPLDQLQHLVTSLDPERPKPLEGGDAPLELKPIVDTINGLAMRLSSRSEVDRRFTRNAAHLLRTPIAAVSVQVANLNNPPSGQHEERLAELQQGVERLTSLASQLLDLANADGEAPRDIVTNVALSRVVHDVVANLFPFAIQRDVDLGAGRIQEVKVRASEADLRILLRNVVDNAIRYSGAGAHVDITVSCIDNVAVILVIDDGHGMTAQQIDQVFERFQRDETHRGNGSGLGLPIARALARRYGGIVELETRSPRATGMIVRIEIPAIPDRENQDDV